jgi:hypothetical protein
LKCYLGGTSSLNFAQAKYTFINYSSQQFALSHLRAIVDWAFDPKPDE